MDQGSRISRTISLLKLYQVLFMVTSCQARVISAPRQARLSLTEPMPYYYYNNIDGNPGSYSYGYDISDPITGNSQYKTEERYPNGTVVGSYGYVDPWGKAHRYRYIADEKGYRVMNDQPIQYQGGRVTTLLSSNPESSSTEPSISWTRKPNKKIKNNKLNKIRQNNLLLPPSYYASDQIDSRF